MEDLKDFVVTYHQLADARAQQKQLSTAKKAATALVLSWAVNVAGVHDAMRRGDPVITLVVEGPYTVTLRKRGGFKEGNVVSDAVLAAAMDNITEQDIQVAADTLLRESQGGVTQKQVIALAVLRAIARLKNPTTNTYKLTTSTGEPTKRTTTLNDTPLRPPEGVAGAITTLVSKDEIAPQVKQLLEKQANISSVLKTSLSGADQPNYTQPLTINMEGDVRQKYILRNSTRVKKPSITGHRLQDFFSAVQHDLLNVQVTPTTLDTAGLKSLTKRLAPNIRQAIKEWQATHSQVVSTLRITAK
jgi:hypothetical protein